MEVMEASEAPCAWSSCPLLAKQSCLGILKQEGAGAITLQTVSRSRTIYAWHGDSAKISYFDGSVSSITVEEAQAKPPGSDKGYLFWRGVDETQ